MRVRLAGFAATLALAGLHGTEVSDAQTAPALPTVMMVVDTSGSMAGSRLLQAKQALTSAVDGLGAGQASGLRSYGGSCGDQGILRTPISTNNTDALRTAIASLTAGGGTPTPDALRGGAADLAGVLGKRMMILVSDGQSTCGDPCPVAAEIATQQGIDFQVHTVGFQAPSSAEGELACVARVTGGQYFSVTDGAGLASAIGSVIGGGGFEYVAVGDSTTTGFSVPTCSSDRERSPYGCVGTPPATPYPELVAAGAQPSAYKLERKGIWGYTLREAVIDAAANANKEGPWVPQLDAAEKATKLVTVSIGANDMKFSDWKYWLGQCLGVEQKKFLGVTYRTDIVVADTSCSTAARVRAATMRANLSAMNTQLDAAKARGARVVTTLYYNPYNHTKQVRFLPDRSCKLLHTISGHITNAMNTELAAGARAHGFTVADLRPRFANHGAGATDSYVFGSDCEIIGALTSANFDLGWPPLNVDASSAEVQRRFDPHPNAKGTRTQADVVLEAIR